MLLQSFWERVGDDWITSKPARLLFGVATSLIAMITFVPFVRVSRNPPPLGNILLGLIGVLAGLSVFFLWSGMWRYWIRRDASSRSARRIWFIILLVGIWYGAVVYYLFVYLPTTRVEIRGRAAY
jgi:uncharacterized membrane-anchored protein